MPTGIEFVFDDGTVQDMEPLQPGDAIHVFTEDGKRVVTDLLVIVCHQDDIRAEVYASPEPAAIKDPMDNSIVDGLIDRRKRVAKVIRGGERRFIMNDVDSGTFELVVKQDVE